MNNTMYKFFAPFLLLILLVSSGCAKNVDGSWKAPLVYRIDVQQGNVVDQEMLDKLRPGMDKNQVKFVMGTPLIKDPFHSERWDYVYIMEPGRGERQQRHITLHFKDEKLAYVEGDVKIGDRTVADEPVRKDRSVDVPLDYHEEGFFGRLFGPDKPETTDTTVETDTVEGTDTVEQTDTDVSIIEEEPVKEETMATKQKSMAPVAEDDTTTTTASKETIADKQQDKNLFRRFWDRMTTGAEDSGIEEGKETERDLRDAEVLEGAGGEL